MPKRLRALWRGWPSKATNPMQIGLGLDFSKLNFEIGLIAQY